MEIGNLIKSVLKSKKITQKVLAKNIGISETALSQIIKGLYFPSPKTISAIETELSIVFQITIKEKDHGMPDGFSI